MADIFTKGKRSQVMSRIRSRGNKDTELKLAAILRAHGISGWRRHQPLPGHPDFVFRSHRLAIFVDGCFWHGCPKHGRTPDTNRAYWLPKLRRNRQRDRQTNRVLRASGWRVLRFWAHDLDHPARVAARISSELSADPSKWQTARAKHDRSKRQNW